jgi:MFS family permease
METSLRAERIAVFTTFALNGAALGSWAPRVPALIAQVHGVPGTFGLALLGASIGMVLAASVSGRIMEWVGPRNVIVASTLLACVFLVLLGRTGSVVEAGFTLFGLGAAIGMLDVAMNMAAVHVERRAVRPIMPSFHAGFSFGALVGSAAAGLAASHGWSPARHLTVAAIVAAIVLVTLIPALPRRGEPCVGEECDEEGVSPMRRPVLWLLAVIALCSAIAEGAASDWSALLMVAHHHVGQGPAAFAYSVFSLAMALSRLGGTRLQEWFGATRVLVAGAALAGAGLIIAAVVPVPLLGYAGFAVAGAGLAASFPVALSLAGNAGKRGDESGGEREVGFVSTIAYSGFLAGPPVVGGLAQFTSISVSFVVVGLIAALIAPAAIAARRAHRREELARA